MATTNQLKNQHLMWRAGFGPMAEDLSQLSTVSQKTFFKSILKASTQSPKYLNVASEELKGMMMDMNEAGKTKKKDLSEDDKKFLRKQSDKDIRQLNLAWLNEMVNSDAQLNEKMSLF